MKLKDKLSFIYEDVIHNSFLDMPVPDEKLANCSECHLCSHENKPRALTKCCDYHPFLPNYIIGAILTHDENNPTEGGRRIKRKIQDKKGVTPYGIMAPLDFYTLLQKSRSQQTARPKQSIIKNITCPYYNNGYCTIWKYRSNMCATYHCNSMGGITGLKYWNTLLQYLKTIESALLKYILVEIGYPNQNISFDEFRPDKIRMEDDNGNVNIKEYEEIWTGKNINEVAFFKDCYEIFKNITPELFQDITGSTAENIENKLINQNRIFHSNLLPEILKFDETNLKVTFLDDHRVKINGQIISLLLYYFLKSFNGTSKTYDIVRKSMIIQKSIANQINPLIKNNILTIIKRDANS